MIVKKDLEKFLNENEDSYVKDKLDLISLIMTNYNPITKYADYKRNIVDINEKVEKLKFIKDSLMIFHRNLYNSDIKKITNILNEIENSPIQKFKAEDTRKTIEELEKHNTLCEEIRKVKDFLLFKKIFENATGKDQAEIFENARWKLKTLVELFNKNKENIEVIFNEKEFKNTFADIKEELGRKNNETKSKKFIEQMKEYFNIENKLVINDLKMIINSKKYEIIVKSIKYFFDNFLNKKLILPKNIDLSRMDLKILKNTLNELKKTNIYDYETNSYDLPFGDPKAIYYDIVHLYRLKNTNKEDNLSSEEIYSKVQDYPINKDGVSLTNLLDMSKDTNQLLLWAQAYQILNKISKDIDQTIHFNKNVVIDPSKLIFWFDFWDTKTFSSQYSISKIGPRELNKTNQNAGAVEYIPYLNNIFLNYAENVSSDENKIQKFYQSNYFQNNKNLQIFRLGKNDQQLLALSEQGLSLASIMNNEIYNHSYMTQNVNITGIPQYFLQPNYLISIVDAELQREDKYVIIKISYQLKAGGTMSIQAVKMLPDIIEKQDTRKEIING